ncbi:hypothetical protein [Nocardia sp. CA-120079]
MMSWSTAGLVVAAGLPLAVLVWAVCWPARVSPRRSKSADVVVNYDE